MNQEQNEQKWNQLYDQISQLYRNGKYREAIPLAQQARQLAVEIWGPTHHNLAISNSWLGMLYKSQNRLAEAERLYLEAIDIVRKALPKDHPYLATGLNNLAGLYDSQNRLAEAERLYLEVTEIDRKALPKDHPDLARDLNNLAELYRTQNRLAEAEPLLIEAIDIDRKALPKDHPSLATHLNNLAGLYQSQNRLAEAERLYLEAIDIVRKALPKDHPQLASHLNNLANLYQSQNRLAEAERLYLEATEIDRKALPKDHPDLATGLNNLAGLYEKQNRQAEAEPLYEEAKRIKAQIAQKAYSHVDANLFNLPGLHAAANRPEQAFPSLMGELERENRAIARAFAASSERERIAYIENNKQKFNMLLTLLWQHFSQDSDKLRQTLDVVLKRKFLTGSAQAAQNEAIYTRYPHLQPQLEKLRELSEAIANLYYSPSSIEKPGFSTPNKQLLSEKEAEYDELQKQLAQETPEIQLQEMFQTVNTHVAASHLQPSAVLLEFVRFDVYNFKEGRYQDPRYLAFILPARQPGGVEMVDLGDAAEIDNLIARYRQALVAYDKSANLEMWDETPPESQSSSKLHLYNKKAGCQLREAVFDKLRPVLGSCRNLVLAPDGDLNLAPLGILPLEWGEGTLRDEYAINSVSSGRELLRNSISSGRQPGQALTVGAPNYDLGVGSVGSVGSAGSVGSVGSGEKLAATLADIPFRHIPETGDLAAAVAQRLGTEALLGDGALVGELLARRSPKVLLVATHGFFFQKRGPQDYYQLVRALLNCPNGEEEKILKRHKQLLDKELLEVMAEVATQLAEKDDEKTANWLRQFAELIEPKINPPAPSGNETAAAPSALYRLDAKVEDPMMRAGIALAGANTWSWGGELPPEAGTGVMFARDFAALDLLATELVILVACQSGLGEVATGEGVFGLRRAVAVAGAKNLIMSLWSVPAYATILLMERLFDYIDAGSQPAEALELAQDYLKNVTAGELNKSELGETILSELGIFIGVTTKTHALEMKPLEHPYYWAAWVCQGVNK